MFEMRHPQGTRKECDKRPKCKYARSTLEGELTDSIVFIAVSLPHRGNRINSCCITAQKEM